MRKDLLNYLAKGSVSVVLLAYLFSHVGGLDRVEGILRGARVGLILLSFLFYMGAVLLSSGKWFVLLRAQGLHVPFRALLSYTLMGTFFNNFLPANVGGDVMRGYGLAQHTPHRTDAAVSVVMDRLIGLLAFLTAAALAGSALLLQQSLGLGRPLDAVALGRVRTLTTLAWLSEGGMWVGLGVLLSRRSKRWLEAGLVRARVLHPLVAPFRRLATALNAYRHAYRALAAGMIISWSVLLLTTTENWLLAQALSPGTIPFLYVLLFNPLIAFALLIPLSVGGLGIGQSAYVFFYGLVGITDTLALALYLLHQAIVYGGSIPGAGLWLAHRRDATEKPAPAPGA